MKQWIRQEKKLAEEKVLVAEYIQVYNYFYGEEGKRPESVSSQKFPIENYRETILKQLDDRRCIVIKGETGSGKTTLGMDLNSNFWYFKNHNNSRQFLKIYKKSTLWDFFFWNSLFLDFY